MKEVEVKTLVAEVVEKKKDLEESEKLESHPEVLEHVAQRVDSMKTETVRRLNELTESQEELKKTFIRLGVNLTPEQTTWARENLEKYRGRIEAIAKEGLDRVILAGFDPVESIVSDHVAVATALDAFQSQKVSQDELLEARDRAVLPHFGIERKLGSGTWKRGYLLKDGRVLKTMSTEAYIDRIMGYAQNSEDQSTGKEEGESAAFKMAVDHMGADLAQRVFAYTEPAGQGIPADIAEFAFVVKEANKSAEKAGDQELKRIIDEAYKENPSVKYTLAENSSGNYGLVKRGDRVYVVAIDFDELGIMNAPGNTEEEKWLAVKESAGRMQGIDPERLKTVPELKEWLDSLEQKEKASAT